LLQIVLLSVQSIMEFILVMHRNCDCAGKAQGYEFQDGPLQASEKTQNDLGCFIVKD